MSFESGSRIGCYEVVSILGAGGMGEVYRARDTKLGRDVALKVLPDIFATDADRLARFQREAQLLASLNHANIGVIHGIEDAGAVRALVLELVEGDTLADRIRRGPLAVDEAIRIGRQIAEALEAAHERGVIHRDLKPANVKITPDGKVKVLDFGLAKAMDTAPMSQHVSHSPTLSLAGTMAGMVLGTAAYMSPEQAKGLPADQRSDVFSFGCVLFEMLTGRQAFQADTAPETLAAVLMRAPDLGGLPPQVPPRMRALVERCLEKDPRRRWQAIGDLRYELDAIAADPAGRQTAELPRVSARRPLWWRAIPFVAAVVVGVVASLVTWWTVRPAPAPLVTRFAISLADVDSARGLRYGTSLLAVAPDGTSLVFAGNRQLNRRSLAEMAPRPISGTNVDPVAPFFSPDGQWVGFIAIQDGTLKKIAVSGGIPITVCKVSGVGGASWGETGIVFVEPAKGIMRVSANGGEPAVIVPLDASDVAYGPQMLDGDRVLFSVTTASGADRWDKAQVVVQSIGSSERKVVVRGGSAARYLPTGHLVYTVGSTVVAVPFDARRLETRGGPVPVIEGVGRARNPAAQTDVAHYAISSNGTLAYMPGDVVGAATPKKLALVDRSGKTDLLDLPLDPYIHPRVSPDGTQLVVGTDDGKEAAIWISDLRARGAPRRLTFGGRNQFPIWTPDGRYVTFQSDREGDQAIFRQLADGSGVPERLTKPERGTLHEPESWSPDGKTLSFNLVRGTNQGIWLWSPGSDSNPRMFVDTPNDVEKHSVFSPDGKWIAYLLARLSVSVGQVGIAGVFVEPFPPTGAKYQVASTIGRTPLWSPDGRQLFYHDQVANRLVVVDVRTDHGFSIGMPSTLPIENTVHPIAQRNYDITPDGKQLLVVLPASAVSETRGPEPQQINVVTNWFEELKARVPVR